MMMNRPQRRKLQLEARRTQRHAREEAAGELLRRVPDLTSLSIAIHETQFEGHTSANHYTRRFVLAHAHALFEVSCSNAICEGGGYDLTAELIASLARREDCAQGERTCAGRCGDHACTGALRYEATATFGKREIPGPPRPSVAFKPRGPWRSPPPV
jgi:hypothetical protein